MTQIAIKFGYPLSTEGTEELSKLAIEGECSIEAALYQGFKRLADYLIGTQKTEEGFFDLCFSVSIEEGDVVCPTIVHQSYSNNGHLLPMLIFKDDRLMIKNSNSCNSHLLTDEDINSFGLLFQNEFDYEFVGFNRF